MPNSSMKSARSFLIDGGSAVHGQRDVIELKIRYLLVEVFIKLLQGLKRFKFAPSVSAFVFGFVVNLFPFGLEKFLA